MENGRPMVDLVANNAAGDDVRWQHVDGIFDNSTFTVKGVEYKDVDNAFKEWIENDFVLYDDKGERVPSYSIFSNSRYSEFTQSWEKSDGTGNMLMNFITYTRESSPNFGKNQDGLYNIPGNRKYTLMMRDVLDDMGKECYEVWSMRQPFSVDFNYRVSIITSKYEMLNKANTLVNDMFKSKQVYVCPNGHFMPMTLESIGDETQYTTEDRKFFIQTYFITLMGYIIPSDSLECRKYPKQVSVGVCDGGVYGLEKASINVEDFEDGGSLVEIDFKKKAKTVKFDMDGKFVINRIDVSNARKAKLVFGEREFEISNWREVESGTEIFGGEEVSIRVARLEEGKPCVMEIRGKYVVGDGKPESPWYGDEE